MIFRGEINRGFVHVRDYLEWNKKYLARCENCRYYRKGKCHNSNVTDYDINIDGDRIWCIFWEVYKSKTKEVDDKPPW